MDLTPLFHKLGIALGLGLLVGMQRERAASRLAGVRTFPLVTLAGSISALLAQSYGGWILAAGFMALAALIFANKELETREGPVDPGLTTEITILLMYGVGAYLIPGSNTIAIAVGAGAAVLLQFKMEIHGLVARLEDRDLKAIMQFALISLVVLPILPNRTFGPFAVLNPRQIWWMVVLIVGLGLAGYIAFKFLGERAGIAAGGFLGGLISSTATTASYARRTAENAGACQTALVVILLASTVVYARLALLVGVLTPAFLKLAAPPLMVMFGVMAAASVWSWLRRGGAGPGDAHNPNNPSELKPALLFGLIYALALFAVAAGKELFGSGALYLVAGVAGLTDLDAIAVSTSQMVAAARLEAEDGWRLILLASLSNLVFKAGVAGVLGHRNLLRKVLLPFGAAILAGVALLVFWP